MEKLSSSLTFVYKLIFVTVMPSLLGLGTLWSLSNPEARSRGLPWLLTILLLLGMAAAFRYAGLKQVWLKGTTLVISNYRDEISVSARDIVEVTLSRLYSPRTITIRLNVETSFGRSIKFMPRLSLTFSDGIVSRLRKMALAMQASSSSAS